MSCKTEQVEKKKSLEIEKVKELGHSLKELVWPKRKNFESMAYNLGSSSNLRYDVRQMRGGTNARPMPKEFVHISVANEVSKGKREGEFVSHGTETKETPRKGKVKQQGLRKIRLARSIIFRYID